MNSIGFLGFGNMARAIAKGIIKSGFIDEKHVHAYDPIEKSIDEFEMRVVKSKSALQVATAAKYIFLCVKPQTLDDAVKSMAAGLSKDNVVISIAAGVTVEHISSIINSVCPVIRVMPNTPLLLGSGATAISRPDNIDETDYSFVCDIFRCVGSLYEIPRDKFNEVTPVNGSSPAFIYLFAKIIAESAKKSGLSYTDALNMFSDTLIGSARMIKESGHSVDTLIDMVSSKGGTTVAALEAMRENGFEQALKEGYRACVQRAYDLGKE